ncbi:MAG: hypothetical protein QHI48_04065 [Bacteroidota bacterium]|nr:hypothetical protein [Bacteroidota bacterium]
MDARASNKEVSVNSPLKRNDFRPDLVLVLAAFFIWAFLLVVLSVVELIFIIPFGDLTLVSMLRWADGIAKALLGIAGIRASIDLFLVRGKAPERVWFFFTASAVVFPIFAAVSLIVGLVTGLGLRLTFLQLQPWYIILLWAALATAGWLYFDRASSPAEVFPEGFGGGEGGHGRFLIPGIGRRVAKPLDEGAEIDKLTANQATTGTDPCGQ